MVLSLPFLFQIWNNSGATLWTDELVQEYTIRKNADEICDIYCVAYPVPGMRIKTEECSGI